MGRKTRAAKRRAAPVVHQIKPRLPLLGRNLVLRQDFAHMHDRAGQPRLAQLVQEDAVQHHAGRGLEAEAHIAQPHRGLAFRHRFRDPAHTLNGFQCGSAIALHTRGDRQHERIEHQVRGVHSVDFDGTLIRPLRDREFAIRRASHGRFLVLVDGADDDRRAEGLGLPEHIIKLVLAILEVGGVDDALAARVSQPVLDGLELRGVQHQRRIHLANDAHDNLGHVAGVVAPRVVHVQVQHVRAIVAYLLAGQRDDPVPVLRLQKLLELLAARGVHAFPDDQEGLVLFVRNGRVQTRDRGLHALGFGYHHAPRGALVLRVGFHHLHNLRDVLRRCAAAPADDAHAILLNVFPQRIGKRLRLQRILRAPLHKYWQARVGHHGYIPASGSESRGTRTTPVFAEPMNVLGHLRRPRRAVQPERENRISGQRGRRRFDAGSHQHRPRRFDRHRSHDRHIVRGQAAFLQCLKTRIDRALHL